MNSRGQKMAKFPGGNMSIYRYMSTLAKITAFMQSNLYEAARSKEIMERVETPLRLVITHNISAIHQLGASKEIVDSRVLMNYCPRITRVGGSKMV